MKRNMLLLIPKFNFPDYNPTNDKIVAVARELLDVQLSESSGIMRYPYLEFIDLSREEVIKIINQDVNLENDAFREEFKLINQEIVNVSSSLIECYTKNVRYMSELGNEISSVQDIHYLIEKHCIKARRLSFVAKPDYSLSTGFSKKSKKKYETIKAFWIDADGFKVRSFSKNVGIDGLQVEESVVKLFESMGYITTQLEYPLQNGYKADLIVEKENQKWIIDIKMRDKKRFFDTYAKLELWKLYKSIYWS